MRFPEFTGEWKKTTLGNCSQSLGYGMNAAAKEYDGVNKYIRITDIDENTSKYKSDRPFSPTGELFDKYLVGDNDILFARTGASTGKTYLYTKNDGRLYYAGFLIKAKIKEKHNAHFVFAQTQTKSYDRWIKLMSMRSGQPGINSKEYASYRLFLPSKIEQDKISTLLSLLDERISTQNKIIEELKQLKSALTNYFFQTNTKWIKCCIGDVLKIGSGKDYKHLSPGCIPVYGTGGYMLSVNGFLYDGDSVCIGRKGTINAPLFLSGKFWTVDTLFYTYDFHNVLPRFCFYLFTTINWLHYNEASGVPSLSKNTIEKIKTAIPSLNKQKYICTILDNIYGRIELEVKINTEYQNLKHYLLQHMFI